METVQLKTSYSVEKIPHNYYPRPLMRRDSFLILNGEWDFNILKNGESDFSGKIIVPYPPESKLSGVCRITKAGDTLVYKRNFNVDKLSGRLLLHFGAVDNKAEVFINGILIGSNKGGYLPFSFDITEYVKVGENNLEVNVTDSLDKTYPYGKQKHKRGGMWYTPISGIWQTVWIEYVPQKYISDIKITTTLNSVKISICGGEEKKQLIIGESIYEFSGQETEIKIETPRLWSPEEPNIYELTLICGQDKIESYFALREISAKKINGISKLCLNGKPYFFNALLDQGYFSDGIYTPASAEVFYDDIMKMKKLGFNTLRKHIKIEPQIFYYYCDICGMAVFQDMVNNGSYSFLYDTALPTIGLKSLPKFARKSVSNAFFAASEKTLRLLYNHPSVVYYTIFNEGWGQHNTKAVYTRLKSLDATRIFDTASGWFKTKHTDVQSEHIYFKKADFKIKGDKPAVLSEFGGYSCAVENHRFNLKKIYGYKICKNREDFTRDIKKLYSDEIIPLINKGLSAAVLTQLSDVEDETNGIMTYDRKVIKPDTETMQHIAIEIKKAQDSP